MAIQRVTEAGRGLFGASEVPERVVAFEKARRCLLRSKIIQDEQEHRLDEINIIAQTWGQSLEREKNCLASRHVAARGDDAGIDRSFGRGREA
ncbi:hypothetical protein KFL_000750352 [Klebsormidium nitens]|uniref:Uncharacterized protein n=1 Tax=Klebsormidium nitens TaxID=105231 RepID=A0A0U9HJ97_KLENI|nr:hypothetical protein KFL_000750352 [Klebsormidium nitens]|eukprot:GAQ81268.1 hypothetical protein KFL_000750352 [Klebsormidium nitens]